MTIALLGWKLQMLYVYHHPFHDLILKMLELLFMACRLGISHGGMDPNSLVGTI